MILSIIKEIAPFFNPREGQGPGEERVPGNGRGNLDIHGHL
ncbi:MAG: hypothetical protein ACYC5N_06755 [Endomicrobiales bacterium]